MEIIAQKRAKEENKNLKKNTARKEKREFTEVHTTHKSTTNMEVIVSEYIAILGSRLEYWKWWFPTDTYHPKNNGRIHLFGKFYWRYE